jgi:hypothetical protein
MPLPEVNVNVGDSVNKAQILGALRAQIAELQTKEKMLKAELAVSSENLRNNLLEQENKCIGLIRITGDDQAPVRVEFRQNGGPLDLSEEAKLDQLFGGARPNMFEKVRAINKITDPQALVDSMKESGVNPWKYLCLGIRPDSNRHVAEANPKGVTFVEGILPKKGLISAVAEVFSSLSNDAKEYIRKYFLKTLKPTVVVGSRGKGGK